MIVTPLPDNLDDDTLGLLDDDQAHQDEAWKALLNYDHDMPVTMRDAMWHESMAELYLRAAARGYQDVIYMRTVQEPALAMAQAHSAQAVALRMRG